VTFLITVLQAQQQSQTFASDTDRCGNITRRPLSHSQRAVDAAQGIDDLWDSIRVPHIGQRFLWSMIGALADVIRPQSCAPNSTILTEY